MSQLTPVYLVGLPEEVKTEVGTDTVTTQHFCTDATGFRWKTIAGGVTTQFTPDDWATWKS